MKITPLDIRQKTFEKNLRGYDKDEVSAFLVSLSQEWERIIDELKEAKIRLETSEREVSKLREVETTLFKTLKTAEDTGASLIEQASKTAELQLKESQIQADGILFEAKTKAKALVEEAESRSQEMLQGLDSRLKELIQEYRSMQSHRDHLASDLLRMAGELSERAERLKKVNDGFNPDQLLNQPKRESAPATQKAVQEIPPQEKTKPVEDKKPNPDPQPEKKEGSFFDTIS
ncbi:MAG: DivIVA domain-containing protein [Bacteroidota bacterium]